MVNGPIGKQNMIKICVGLRKVHKAIVGTLDPKYERGIHMMRIPS
jgi:hypothetical protein